MSSKKACDSCWSVKLWELETFFNWQLTFVSTSIKTAYKLILNSLEWVGNPVFDNNVPSSFLDILLGLLLALLGCESICVVFSFYLRSCPKGIYIWLLCCDVVTDLSNKCIKLSLLDFP